MPLAPQLCAARTGGLARIASTLAPSPGACGSWELAPAIQSNNQPVGRTCGRPLLAAPRASLRLLRQAEPPAKTGAAPPARAGCPWLRWLRRTAIELQARVQGCLKAAAAPPALAARVGCKGGSSRAVGRRPAGCEPRISGAESARWGRRLPWSDEHAPVGESQAGGGTPCPQMYAPCGSPIGRSCHLMDRGRGSACRRTGGCNHGPQANAAVARQ